MSTKEKFQLIETGNRSSLGEGRNYGVAFMFAKREKNKLTTIAPISACREYLNDALWSQHTGKKCSAYGFYGSPVAGLFNKGLMYMAFGIEPYNGGGKYQNYDRDYAQMAKNYQNLEKFVNFFEKAFKLKKFTKIIKIKENRYVAIQPDFWAKAMYLTSLSTLLMRVGFFYDGKTDPMEYLTNYKYNNDDIYMVQNVIPKIKQMMDGYIPFEDFNSTSSPHGRGIVSGFPPKETKMLDGSTLNLAAVQKTETIVKLNKNNPLNLQPAKF